MQVVADSSTHRSATTIQVSNQLADYSSFIISFDYRRKKCGRKTLTHHLILPLCSHLFTKDPHILICPRLHLHTYPRYLKTHLEERRPAYAYLGQDSPISSRHA